MSTTHPSVELAASIRSALAGVRLRIRAFVWVEALALAVIWLGATFWIALALDYFPVLVWASEMPRPARGVLLAIIAAGLAWVLYRYFLRRAFVPISDRSLAVLLERKFDVFHDSLVTAVELAGPRGGSNAASLTMLDHTHEDAQLHVARVPLGSVFNWRPLITKVLLALVMLASVGGFYVMNASALELAGERIYLLNDTPWPRSAQIEVAGIDIQHAPAGEGRAAVTQSLAFQDSRAVKVGRGANVVVRVQADAKKRVPETCVIYYRTSDGDRGNVAMKKIGRAKDGYQAYTFDGKPFKGMLADLRFDVMGYDHRVRDYRIEVVDSPALVSATLDCVYPSYIVDHRLVPLPPKVKLAPGTELPMGTRVGILLKSNKPLQKLEVYDPATSETQTLSVSGGEEFALPARTLTDNLTLELTFFDADGVRSDRPQRLYIAATRDESPRVSVKLAGISSLVTPDVLLPLAGEIHDDHGVGKTWADLQINDRSPEQIAIALPPSEKLSEAFDFRELRAQDSRYELKPKDKISLVVVGQDRHDLEGGPHTGFGDRWDLQVVTPDELMASLEARELGLRRRFEQIIVELTETRDELIRASQEAKAAAAKPMADAELKDADAVKSEDGLSVSLRTLIAQRATQQSQKSAQEIAGVAASFAEIREELINNRVDTEERKTRLKEQISDPLAAIVKTRFPDFDKRLGQMEQNVDDPARVQLALDEANEILLDLDAILQRMLDLETYNELVELVRSLIEEQEKLIGETKKQQAADLLK